MSSLGQHNEKVLSPSVFAHIVLRTTAENLRPMAQFYKTFLGAHVSYENDYASFLAYDHEHHRIALIAIPHTDSKATSTCGLEHFAFTYNTLKELALSYQQRKALGMEPHWCVNHGPTTSMYYKDPDGNKVEIQVDNLSNDEATAFMMSKEFDENPVGVDFDPEELVLRVESGEDEASIKKRPNIGPRSLPHNL
ncbi:glyoxalase bleomycin resistance protein dioxygenase [Cadophora sp. DSE1049]|nr:glyoxalase bleomycin resistance protein dioxygenase [Cadophora sp. DSE1049]